MGVEMLEEEEKSCDMKMKTGLGFVEGCFAVGLEEWGDRGWMKRVRRMGSNG